VQQGTVGDLVSTPQFDAVLYIDVLEHIEDDVAEAAAAVQLIRPGGHLAVLAPAHDFLFSPFDEAIGHFRRYSKRSLAAAIPAELRCLRLDYLDAAGLLASLANRLLFRASKPTTRQVAFWDSMLVPLSKRIDLATGYRIGKSVLGVWER
jgi:2-polyprenyl-3-methyl-5-hydroxy-6-metoxy-1,4-benzoquinol methylase